ncbi:MAG: bifunctional protein-disulfide isomerase/oxidoreductase DsbC [Gammaproteobacteria bacterium]|nr:MAG: bifunctional protein-disulfide isomerase/oxidoreductase DsbC [Gammaproteobacteria bacterium]
MPKILWGLVALAWLSPAFSGVEAIRQSLSQVLPGEQADSIEPSPVPGLYEVSFGGTILYVSEDGRYLIQGDLLDLKTRENITEKKRAKARIKAIESLGEKNMVVFSPPDPKYTITVFTDIDCTYCRKLHSQIKAYNALGIKVRYLAFPRAGIGSPSYEKAVSVWCAEDRQKAMTLAKAGKPIEKRTCPNPVAKEYQLGKAIGVNGTPAIILEDGTLIPGYVPPERLLKILEERLSAKR